MIINFHNVNFAVETCILLGTAPIRENLYSSTDLSGAALFTLLKDVTHSNLRLIYRYNEI